MQDKIVHSLAEVFFFLSLGYVATLKLERKTEVVSSPFLFQ